MFRPRRNSLTRSGVSVVMAWPTAERSASGATTVTEPRRLSESYSACRPGEVMPSSFVRRMRRVRLGNPKGHLAELLGGVETLEGGHHLVERMGGVHHRANPAVD